KVLGVGDASGMFPIDSINQDYDASKMKQFDELIHPLNYAWTLEDVLPEVLIAGEAAGKLTKEGALLLDETGMMSEGIRIFLTEGDEGTGMIATNSVREHTGNVSAGTSIFSMIVLEEPLSDYYTEIDMVTTPSGNDVAMVHCNNFTSDINAWIRLFEEVIESTGVNIDKQSLITSLFEQALTADADVGNLVHCIYYT